MPEQAVETEKAKAPSEFIPKSLHEGLDRFAKDQAAKPSEEAVKAQPEGKPGETQVNEEECPECEKEKRAKAAEAEKAAAAAKPSWFLTDEKGEKKIPFGPIKADGKEYDWETPEKLMNWASLGIHSNTRLEEIKKAEGMLQQIMDAIQQGRVEIKDGKLIATPPSKAKASEAKAEEESEAEAGNEDYLSPEVREANKRIKALETDLATLKKNNEALAMMAADDFFKKEKAKLDDEISKFRPKYPLAREKDIWNLLKLTENDQPKYSVEDALRIAHEEEYTHFNKFKTEHPEFVGKDEIIANYLREKGDKEKAPVASPSPESAPSPKVENRVPKNLRQGLAFFMEDQDKALRAKTKF